MNPEDNQTPQAQPVGQLPDQQPQPPTATAPPVVETPSVPDVAAPAPQAVMPASPEATPASAPQAIPEPPADPQPAAPVATSIQTPQHNKSKKGLIVMLAIVVLLALLTGGAYFAGLFGAR